MRTIISIVLILMLLSSASVRTAGARTADTSSVPYLSERIFLDAQYSYVYGTSPAMLSWWDYPVYSEIGVTMDYGEGRLHHPQTYDRLLMGQIHTRSKVRLEKTGWTFSGSFIYENGNADSVRSNLSYHLRDNGTPSFYFCRQPAARWNLQKYGLEAAAAKKLGERWSLGVSAAYTGDMAFRKSDVRNAQTTLSIDLKVSASFKINRNHTVSAGAAYKRIKEKPGFSIIYSTGPEYTIYLMNGAGTYLSELQSNMVWQENTPGAFVQWMQNNDENILSVSYSFNAGKNGWYSKGIQAASRQELWASYGYMTHGITFSESAFFGNSSLHFRGSAEMTSGNGETWNRTSSVFIKNYSYAGVNAEASLEWRPGIKVLESVRAGTGYINERRNDRSYNYLLGYSLMDFHLEFRTGFHIGKVYSGIFAEGRYRHSLSLNHHPGAADNSVNLYTVYIGTPLGKWLGQDTAGISAGTDFDIPAGRSIISAGGKYRLDLSPGSNEKFHTAQLFINILF